MAPGAKPPWGGQPITVGLSSPVNWLSPGIYATNTSHVPSRVYISDVKIHDKLGRGILLGTFHVLVQNSSFRNITATGLASFISGYFHESTGSSDVAIRNNTFVGTNYVPKLYQTSADGTNYYPAKDASIVMSADLSTTYDSVWNEITGIYPAFQDIEISGNFIRSVSGAGIFLTGARNDRVDSNEFAGCAPVPDPDPIYSYFGSQSKSALVLSFAEDIAVAGNVPTADPTCTARTDFASSRNVLVRR
jgi:hypothetical protein